MIGILCNKDKVKKYEEYFYVLIKKYIKKEDEGFLIFTMENLDITNKLVWGSKVYGKKIGYGSEKIPEIIFNFSVQYKKVSINKLRILNQIEGVRLINEVNRFDQFSILEMLNSNNITKKYLIEYKEFKFKNDININPQNDYILIPRKGADLSKVLHMKLDGLDINIRNDDRCLEVENKNLNRKVYKFIKVKEGIILTARRDILCKEDIFTVRVYLQRGENGVWNMVIRRINYKGRGQAFILNKDFEDASLIIAKCIGNYIPSMATCFIDFIISGQGKPYFLHFGGWSKMLLDNKDNNTLNKKFSYNLMKFIKYCNELERRLNDVG